MLSALRKRLVRAALEVYGRFTYFLAKASQFLKPGVVKNLGLFQPQKLSKIWVR